MIEVSRAATLDGVDISSAQNLIAFRGIGNYIANAVECLTQNKPAPMVDGPVGRLLNRIFHLPGKKPAYADPFLWNLAYELLSVTKKSCKEINLGLIDIAATFCKIKQPKCLVCQIMSQCDFTRKKIIFIENAIPTL